MKTKKNKNKFFLILTTFFIITACNFKNETKVERKIKKIIIVSDYFTKDTKTFEITDRKRVAQIYNEIISFKNKTDEQIKPFLGNLVVTFIYDDIDKLETIIPKLDTGIIIKKNGFLISNYRGTFIDDKFSKKIINLFESSLSPSIDQIKNENLKNVNINLGNASNR